MQRIRGKSGPRVVSLETVPCKRRLDSRSGDASWAHGTQCLGNKASADGQNSLPRSGAAYGFMIAPAVLPPMV